MSNTNDTTQNESQEDSVNTSEDVKEESTDEVEEATTSNDEPETSGDDVDLSDRFSEKPEKQTADDEHGDTVSLGKYTKEKHKRMEAQEKAKALESEVASLKDPSSADIKKLADEHDIDPELVRSIVAVAERSVEAKVSSRLEKSENIQRKANAEAAFNKAFENEVIAKYPQLASKREQIKALCVTSSYRKTSLAKIAEDVYGDFIDASEASVSSESETRPSGGNSESTLDFANLSKEGITEVIKDPETKSKYFAWLDENEV